MQTATQKSMPPHLRMGQNYSETIVNKPEDKRFIAVFFAGDILLGRQKRAQGYALGGKLLPDAQTVPNNYIARCAITPLRQAMLSVNKGLIDPAQHRNYVDNYTSTNVWNPVTEQFEDVHIGAEKNLLFSPLPPSREVGQISGGGVVRIPHVERPSDVKEAQLYFFPNWFEIATERAFLPTVLSELEEYFAKKIATASSIEYQEIGSAMLQSCAEFRIFGKEYIDRQTAVIEEAKKTPGNIAAYDEVAERMFKMLEITRADSLVQDFARQQNSQQNANAGIAEAIKMMAENVSRQPAPSAGMSNEDIVRIAQIVAMTMQQNQNAAPLAPLPPMPTNNQEMDQQLNAGVVEEAKPKAKADPKPKTEAKTEPKTEG